MSVDIGEQRLILVELDVFNLGVNDQRIFKQFGRSLEDQQFGPLHIDLEKISAFEFGDIVEAPGLDGICFLNADQLFEVLELGEQGVFGSNKDEVIGKLHS